MLIDQETALRIFRVFSWSLDKKFVITIYQISMPSIAAPTHRIQYEYTQKQCVGVAIEGMDIWYMGLITYSCRLLGRQCDINPICSLDNCRLLMQER